MVNSKNVIFRVNRQSPSNGPPPQAYGTVINCRKPGGKRALRREKEIKSQRVRLARIPGTEGLDGKRKRGDEDADDLQSKGLAAPIGIPGYGTSSLAVSTSRPAKAPKPHVFKPTKLRKGRILSKSVDMDCWHAILSFSHPAQLLELRTKISSCYRFLRDYPTLWKHSRTYHYGDDLPDPPSELSEFQYADLRHGHGCMSCKAQSTRKTYWAFLRRWCKACLQSKTIKEHDALALFTDENGEDLSFLQKCLPSGIVDSWGNYGGVGPTTTPSLKTVYLLSDVTKLVAGFIEESKRVSVLNPAEIADWIAAKLKIVEERHEFARNMELWEEATRHSRSFKYTEKKQARKTFFIWKAGQLSPPMSMREVESCPSYRRAILIPKNPTNASWLQLKPKLEKEVADLRAKDGLSPPLPIYPASENSTPSTDFRY